MYVPSEADELYGHHPRFACLQVIVKDVHRVALCGVMLSQAGSQGAKSTVNALRAEPALGFVLPSCSPAAARERERQQPLCSGTSEDLQHLGSRAGPQRIGDANRVGECPDDEVVEAR